MSFLSTSLAMEKVRKRKAVNDAKTLQSCQINTLSSIELPPTSAHSQNVREEVWTPLTPLFSVLVTENR